MGILRNRRSLLPGSAASILILSVILLWLNPGVLRSEEGGESEAVSSFPVKILVAGDTHFQWGIRDLQLRSGFLAPVENLRALFSGATFRVLNLETTLTDKGDPLPGKSHIFQDDPDQIDLLDALHVDLVTLGNNHAMDMGREGLLATMENLRKRGIASLGAGENQSDATAPYYANVDGIRIAFLSYSVIGETEIFALGNRPGVSFLRTNPYLAIREAAREADHVVVMIHWGREYRTSPEPYQVRVARTMIDSGATAVIGHHPHIPQGLEHYKNGVILYSLGNFLFGSVNQFQNHNLIAELEFRKDSKKLTKLRLFPLQGRYRTEGHSLRLLNAQESREFWKELYVQSSDISQRSLDQWSLESDGSCVILIDRD